MIKELGRMETMGVIERVKVPTDWISALVVVRNPVERFGYASTKTSQPGTKTTTVSMTTIED